MSRAGGSGVPPWRAARLGSACALLILVLTACSAQARQTDTGVSGQAAATPVSAGSESEPPRTIDPDSLRLSYSEEFHDNFSISSWGCVTDWIAHTPWRGDFGDAPFADPVRGFPLTVENDLLAIEARKFQGGRWMSGMMSARNICGGGWSQLYGYFEIRAKLPKGPGFWPAFWLIGVNPNHNGTAEIDVFEYYSARPDGYSLGVIKHPGVSDLEKRVAGKRHDVEPGLLSSQFNTFGLEIDAQETTFYFNRTEVFSTPTEKEFRQPLFMLLSLATIEADMTEETPDSAKMYVDYLRVYQRLSEP